MDEFIGNATGSAEQAMTKQLIPPTLSQRLEMEQSNLEARLAEVKEALEALKANPEIERVLNLVGKAQRRF